jgi:hypothetical protein
MPYIAIGGQGSGKSYFIREYVVDTLLYEPERITPNAPAGGYRLALVDDPLRPETGHQYPHAQRFEDVAEFRRAKRHMRLCAFEHADRDELVRLAFDVAKETGGCALIVDEFDKRFPSGDPAYKDRGATQHLYRLIEEPRHYGVVSVGGVRAAARLHKQVRENCQGAWVGATEPEDSDYVADLIGLTSRKRELVKQYVMEHHPPSDAQSLLDKLQDFSLLEAHEFIEWNRAYKNLTLTRIVSGVKVDVTLYAGDTPWNGSTGSGSPRSPSSSRSS